MFLISTELREKFNISGNAFHKQLERAIFSAQMIIRGSVDADVYTEAEAAALDSENENYVRQTSVVQAHAYLSFYFLLKDAGLRLTESGVLKSFQAGNSPATSSVLMNTVVSPKDLAPMKKDALNSAKFFLGDYGTISIDEDGDAAPVITESTLKWF